MFVIEVIVIDGPASATTISIILTGSLLLLEFFLHEWIRRNASSTPIPKTKNGEILIIELKRTPIHPKNANVEAIANIGDPTEVAVSKIACFIEKSRKATLNEWNYFFLEILKLPHKQKHNKQTDN